MIVPSTNFYHYTEALSHVHVIFSQFDLISFRQKNLTFTRREGDFSTLQVSFNLQRHTGYFLIQVICNFLHDDNHCELIKFMS